MNPYRTFAARVALALVLISGAGMVSSLLPSCKTADAVSVPAEVVTLTVNRGVVWAGIEERIGDFSDDQMADALLEDSAAWAYVRDSASFVTPAALKSTAQSQKIATEVAAGKIRRGDYTDAQELELVQSLRSAWAGLARYYNPN